MRNNILVQNSTTELVTVEESRRLLEEFNDITPRQTPDKTIVAQFEEQAAKNPNTKILAFG